jgi:hypothetical protein
LSQSPLKVDECLKKMLASMLLGRKSKIYIYEIFLAKSSSNVKEAFEYLSSYEGSSLLDKEYLSLHLLSIAAKIISRSTIG